MWLRVQFGQEDKLATLQKSKRMTGEKKKEKELGKVKCFDFQLESKKMTVPIVFGLYTVE